MIQSGLSVFQQRKRNLWRDWCPWTVWRQTLQTHCHTQITQSAPSHWCVIYVAWKWLKPFPLSSIYWTPTHETHALSWRLTFPSLMSFPWNVSLCFTWVYHHHGLFPGALRNVYDVSSILIYQTTTISISISTRQRQHTWMKALRKVW